MLSTTLLNVKPAAKTSSECPHEATSEVTPITIVMKPFDPLASATGVGLVVVFVKVASTPSNHTHGQAGTSSG